MKDKNSEMARLRDGEVGKVHADYADSADGGTTESTEKHGKQGKGLDPIAALQDDGRGLEIGDLVVTDAHQLSFKVKDKDTGKPVGMHLILLCDWRSRHILLGMVIPRELVNKAMTEVTLFMALDWRIPKVVIMDNSKGVLDERNPDVDALRALGVGVGRRWSSDTHRDMSIFFERFHRLLNMFLNDPKGCGSFYDLPENETWVKKLLDGEILDACEATDLVEFFATKVYDAIPQKALQGKTPGEVFGRAKRGRA